MNHHASSVRRSPLLLLLLAAVPACTAVGAKQVALLPSLQQSWPKWRGDVQRELAAAPDPGGSAAVAAADAALQDGAPAAVAAVDWRLLVRLAEGDIARRAKAGDLGPDVAEIMRARLRRFLVEIDTYTNPNP
jgi:hypothetical protein